jgi:hypothetical protein
VIGALDMPHESSSALSNEVITLRAQVKVLRDSVQAYKHRHESGGPFSEIRPDWCRCSQCDIARAALELAKEK